MQALKDVTRTIPSGMNDLLGPNGVAFHSSVEIDTRPFRALFATTKRAYSPALRSFSRALLQESQEQIQSPKTQERRRRSQEREIQEGAVPGHGSVI